VADARGSSAFSTTILNLSRLRVAVENAHRGEPMEGSVFSGYRIPQCSVVSQHEAYWPAGLSAATCRGAAFCSVAGRAGYTYPDILAIQAGSVRLLVPFENSQAQGRAVLTLVGAVYALLVGPILAAYGLPAMALAAIACVGSIVLYWSGSLRFSSGGTIEPFDLGEQSGVRTPA